ncbi:polymer-forming cytoskeletal protein [Cupriavidus sp. WS]|uniref:polymer-forming cytoskeletal protein n=1 Tax=Cupriavidus sp. WS TaxID=1312922 RepID=UPI00035D7897|nr:polymer-forming cytoskeletal protein [Cupriavidus sp. WS]
MDNTPNFSLIQAGLCIHGDLVSDHGITCMGIIDGDVSSSSGLVHIARGAVIRGSVEGEHVVVDGVVEGEVKARTSLLVNGRVMARIFYGGTIRLGIEADLEGTTISRVPSVAYAGPPTAAVES